MATINEELVLGDRFSATFAKYITMAEQAGHYTKDVAKAARQATAEARMLAGAYNVKAAEAKAAAMRQKELAAASLTEAAASKAAEAHQRELMATTLNQAAASKVATAALREKTAALQLTIAEEKLAGVQAKNAADAQDRLNRKFREGAGAVDSLLGKLRPLVSTYIGLQGAQKALNLSDTLTSTRARLNLIVDDGGSVEGLEQKIMASAQRSRAAYFDTASAIAKMGANAGAAFKGNDELIAFMEQVNKQFVLGGASAQEQANAMLQLTQAMGAGALRGEELNSILEQAPGIARAIERYMGAAEGSIKSYAEQGVITAEVVKNALFAAADETNAKFASMPMTWAQMWTSMKNHAITEFEPVLERLNEIANSEKAQKVFNGLIDGMGTLANVASNVLEFLVNAGSFVVDNWSAIEPVIWGVVTALGAYRTAQGLCTKITKLAEFAQNGFNASLLACPVTWIVGGIFAIITVITALMRHFDVFGAKSTTVFGTLCGEINIALQFFVNLGLGVANVALGIGNVIAALGHNIRAYFHNAIVDVQSDFYGLLATVLAVVSKICGALNSLPFIEFDYSGISNKAADYAKKAADIQGQKQEYHDLGTEFNRGFHTFDAFSSGWAARAFRSGAAWGDSIMGKTPAQIGGAATGRGPGTGGGTASGMNFTPYSEIANISDKLDKIGSDTGSIRDSVSLSEEDLKLMVDMAQREYVNNINLTTQTPINVYGANTGNSEYDRMSLAESIKMILLEEAASHTNLSYT